MGQNFVIDNSIVMAWCFRDENNKHADAVLGALGSLTGYVPAIWPLEVGNVLLVAERRNRITRAGITRFVSLLDELPIIVIQEHPARMFNEILNLAQEYNISTYDASYLDLAMRNDLPLATLDLKLISAAELSGTRLYTTD